MSGHANAAAASSKPKSNHYRARFRLKNGEWLWMSARADGTPYDYLTLERASESTERAVSLDGCIEGEVYDDQGNRVEQWVAGAYRSSAQKVEAVRDATTGEPGTSKGVG